MAILATEKNENIFVATVVEEMPRGQYAVIPF
jgi:hypothetical protein